MNTSLSRRGFAKVLGAGAAYAALNPSFAQITAGACGLVKTAAPALVRLNSNENPYGPSPLAVKAMTDAFSLAWRYPDEHEAMLSRRVGETERRCKLIRFFWEMVRARF